nr:PRC-barrel domain-containing protein [uncultured Rhodopila sp.]
MKKLTTVLTAAALALMFAPSIITPASAQSQSPSAMVAQTHSLRASKLIGTEVYNDQGEDLGKLEDILVKDTVSEPLAVLSVGGFVGGGDKLVVVPLSHISLKADKASMSATKAEMAALPKWQFSYEGGGN